MSEEAPATNLIIGGPNYSMAKFRRMDPEAVVRGRIDSQIVTVINDTDDEHDNDSVVSDQSDASVIIVEDDDIYGETGSRYRERKRMERRLDTAREMILEKLDLLETQPHEGSINRQMVHRLEEFNRILNTFLF